MSRMRADACPTWAPSCCRLFSSIDLSEPVSCWMLSRRHPFGLRRRQQVLPPLLAGFEPLAETLLVLIGLLQQGSLGPHHLLTLPLEQRQQFVLDGSQLRKQLGQFGFPVDRCCIGGHWIAQGVSLWDRLVAGLFWMTGWKPVPRDQSAGTP